MSESVQGFQLNRLAPRYMSRRPHTSAGRCPGDPCSYSQRMSRYVSRAAVSSSHRLWLAGIHHHKSWMASSPRAARHQACHRRTPRCQRQEARIAGGPRN
eukprot:4565570-Prymnesium_polylepis.2